MSDQDRPPQPEPPPELWMLWLPDETKWVLCGDFGNTYYTTFDEDNAALAAETYSDTFDENCVPVRVK